MSYIFLMNQLIHHFFCHFSCFQVSFTIYLSLYHLINPAVVFWDGLPYKTPFLRSTDQDFHLDLHQITLSVP